jgi:predicted metalloprotease with PDZ domain
MTLKKPYIAIFVSLFFIAPLLAGVKEKKKCLSTPKECEQQIRKMLTGQLYLGVEVNETKMGLFVKSVTPDSPADRADLRERDRIISIDGHDLTGRGVRDFRQVLSNAGKERPKPNVWLLVQRGNGFRRLDALLEPVSDEQIEKIVASHMAEFHSTGK